MELVKKTKGKNIIISSACRDILELRGVFDVINLSTLFSLNPNQARDAISINSKKAVFHGISRQESFRGMTSFEKVDDVPESKQWKVQRLKESIDVHNKG
jgi:ribonuclease P/MRP protein subunit RPP1